MDVASLRAREFPWMNSGDAIYLNAASTGPLPRRTVDVLSDWADRRATPHVLNDNLLFETLSRSRELSARLIGARPREIACAINTGYGLSVAARALPLTAGDVILTPDGEFPANVYPWMASARDRGLDYRRFPVRDGVVDEDALIAALDDHSVKCLAVSWVSFASGCRLDLARLGRICRSRGIFFVVDAIQGLGALTLDVHSAEIDILACGAQKWLLSPWGSGFVYVREELAKTLEPPLVSWMAPRGTDDFTRLLDYDLTWREDARRFELITLPFQDFAGMNASLELLLELGPAAIETHVASLADEIVSWAESRSDVQLLTPAPAEKRAGVVSIRPRDGAAVSRMLRDAGVVHSFREGAIRLAPHAYNTVEEIRGALSLLERKAR